MIQEIIIIDKTKEVYSNIKKSFKNEKNYKIKLVKKENIHEALNTIPAMFILNEKGIEDEILDLSKKIRENEDNKITPVLVTMSENKEKAISIMQQNIECSFYPIDYDYMFYKVKNINELLFLNRKVSPLTGLPGNVQIQLEIRKALLNKEPFSLLYFDLDNFKSYNDVYGFLKGDEIIKFTARIIMKCLQENNCEDSFLGHIGGDDFVAIIRQGNHERVCRDVIEEFDTNVKDFFSNDDFEQGYLEVANRKGVIEQFPLTTISIGVVEATTERFDNSLQIGEAGAQVKHMAKSILGSSYIIDRRKNKFI